MKNSYEPSRHNAITVSAVHFEQILREPPIQHMDAAASSTFVQYRETLLLDRRKVVDDEVVVVIFLAF